MAKREDRLKKLAKICDTINKGKFGGDNKDALQCLAGNTAPQIETWSSGASSIDDALGGGWPRGRIIEIYGKESSGKSTICLHAIAEFQKKYPEEDVALVDSEFAFDPIYAKQVGVDVDLLLVNQPESGEQALNIVEDLIDIGVKLIIVDSVASLTTQAELDGDIGDQHMAQVARLMSGALKKIIAKAGKQNATVIFTNQIRDKIGVIYGEKTTTPGGNALKFYSSVRVQISNIGAGEKDGEVRLSNKTKIVVKKNKVAPPFKIANFMITFGYGIDSVAALLDDAVEKNIIKKKGAWFSLNGDNVAQGRKQLLDMIRTDEKFKSDIKLMIANYSKSDLDEDEEVIESEPARRGRKKKSETSEEDKIQEPTATAEEV